MPKTLSVAAIKDGTVIDHIPAGGALLILQLLKLVPGKHRISLGINFNSSSMGYKDLIKIENRLLTDEETQYIAVFAPVATINTVKNYQICNKVPAKLPNIIKKVLVCPNSRCITNFEQIDTRFSVLEHKRKVLLLCQFCEKTFERDEIRDYKP